ncbi:MAG: LysR family transcriptional regulator [Candidatus Rokubacteria bacterium]|nr:LysR family transcriptional regulator [Candidatus Rokubacteria bacterium]MBI3105379.1 LysR family transcriptional regulator [Candidatus Rokubacteria bacterium]
MDVALFPALETLLAVSSTGSVGAAARQRHVTSSAVSQQIRRLENHFGMKLFERAGRGVRLTAAGETALPVVRELWGVAESVFARLAELAGRPATTLRMAASDYLGKGLLAPVLRDLLDEAPPLRFEIVTTHSRAGVRLVQSGDVDLAVVTGQETPRGLEDRHLFDQPFVWVGPRRGRRGQARLTERLRQEPVLRLAAESRSRVLLDQYLADQRIRPVSTIDVPSVSLLLSYVSGGLGIGLVPALALAGAPPDRIVSEPARVPSLPVTLVWRPATRRQPALTRLAALLVAAGGRAGARLTRARAGRTRSADHPASPPAARGASRRRSSGGGRSCHGSR